MMAKVHKRWAVTILGVILWIIRFVTGMHWAMALGYLIMGIIADLVAGAGQKKSAYILSVIFAVIGAVFQIIPFFVMAQVIGKLLAGNKDLADYLIDCAVMAAFWLLRVLFHSLSTVQSHKAPSPYLVITESRDSKSWLKCRWAMCRAAVPAN